MLGLRGEGTGGWGEGLRGVKDVRTKYVCSTGSHRYVRL